MLFMFGNYFCYKVFKIWVKIKNIVEFGYMSKILKNDKMVIEKDCIELIIELIISVISVY